MKRIILTIVAALAIGWLVNPDPVQISGEGVEPILAPLPSYQMSHSDGSPGMTVTLPVASTTTSGTIYGLFAGSSGTPRALPAASRPVQRRTDPAPCEQ